MTSTKFVKARQSIVIDMLQSQFDEAYLGETKRDDDVPRATAQALTETRDRAETLLVALMDDYGNDIAADKPAEATSA